MDSKHFPHPPLEPITTLLVLATVPYYGSNPKIGVYDGKLIVGTSSGVLTKYKEAVVRTYNKMGKDDLARLFDTVLQLQYWLLDKKCWYSEYPELKNLVRMAIGGLKTIQNTYKTGIAVFAIQHIINCFSDVIDERLDSDRLYNAKVQEWIDRDKLINHEEIVGLWNRHEVDTIKKVLDECIQVDQDSNLSLSDRQRIIKSKLTAIETSIEHHHNGFMKMVAYKS